MQKKKASPTGGAFFLYVPYMDQEVAAPPERLEALWRQIPKGEQRRDITLDRGDISGFIAIRSGRTPLLRALRAARRPGSRRTARRAAGERQRNLSQRYGKLL